MHRFLSSFLLCSASCLFLGCGADTETEVLEEPSAEEAEAITEYESQQEEEMDNPEYR